MATYQELSQKIALLRNQAARSEGALEQAELHYASTISRITELGIEPQNIDAEIQKLALELEEGTRDLKRSMDELAWKIQSYTNVKE